MLRKLSVPALSTLCLVLPLAWVAACSSSSSSTNNPNGGSDAGNNTSNGDGDSTGDGDGPAGDGDNDTDAGNSANGDGDPGDGDSDAGNGAGGAGGSSNGAGGMGPGLGQGEVNCLGAERMDLSTAFYFGYHQLCTSSNAQEGTLTEMQAGFIESMCAGVYAGTVVDSCSDDNVVAYCAGEEFAPGGIIVNATRRVYGGPVNPDAEAVARNAFAICGALPVYDLNDNLLTATCSGTVTAMVDDELMDFSDNLTCTFRTDGTQTTYFVRATKDPNSLEIKELTLKIIKNGDGISYFTELNTIPVGYLEGATAAGAFAFETENTDLTLDITSYSDEGEGFAGTFSIGELATGSDAVRLITDGNIDVQFTVN
ncbi:MAG TPA: hypothetical protein VHO25_04730 [Polyangiaceae bacterium]|nr:hypothetical protein [Polyangiaceae bacterium]